MKFMVIEQFRGGDSTRVYARFQEHGRMLPDGLKYIDSWVDINSGRCFQLMETEDPKLFDKWIGCWNDLVQFEIIPVVTSAEAAEQGPNKL
ncbi:MAG TPA: DUF3303 family protein [Pyrinomonadaceae bacterium]|nr:DUF3303 family protein [Pyrinomonadaceae bacterium]